jgi:hypothetical protein
MSNLPAAMARDSVGAIFGMNKGTSLGGAVKRRADRNANQTTSGKALEPSAGHIESSRLEEYILVSSEALLSALVRIDPSARGISGLGAWSFRSGGSIGNIGTEKPTEQIEQGLLTCISRTVALLDKRRRNFEHLRFRTATP